MKKLALVMAVAGALCSFSAFGQGLKGLTGVEVSSKALSKVIPHNMVLAVILDDEESDTAQTQSGCWKRIDGQLIWVNPCW
ncbi:MAG: hypothetical protein P9F19_14380 [Candidatus Contendobacter sp.]|nr:hypothetical protein [Candidatus Contendobacter sp.]MDG4558560.1 hypothetical protein [Candidatus Contendobacter sp.]